MSSSTAPRKGEEGEQRPTDHKDSVEERSCKEAHTARAPRSGGGDAGRPWSWKSTKALERSPGSKGRVSRGPHDVAAGRSPPDRRVVRTQEGPLEELQEDTAGEGRRCKNVLATRAPRSSREIAGRPEGPGRPPERTLRRRITKVRESSPGHKGRASRRPHGGEAGRPPLTGEQTSRRKST